MAKGDYYFPLFYQRLLTSTTGWTDQEFGAYIRLLIYQFDNGSIPSDINQIARIAPSAKKVWSLLSTKFIDNGNGGLINTTMDEIRKETKRKQEIRKELGKRGGRPKKEKPKGFDLGNQLVNQKVPETETKTKAIPITNNQYPKEEREPPPDFLGEAPEDARSVFDVETMLTANPIRLEEICMATGLTQQQARESLRSYHLHLEEKMQYPLTRKAASSGFEKWARREKTFQQSAILPSQEKRMVY